jgi:hypothetical protein
VVPIFVNEMREFAFISGVVGIAEKLICGVTVPPAFILIRPLKVMYSAVVAVALITVLAT